MPLSIKHAKTNNIADWTQADLDAAIAKGQFPAGTTLNDITLASDWNQNHTLDTTGLTVGYVLTVTADGADFIAPSGGMPAGSNTQVQYNNGGVFGASAGFTYNGQNLTINNSLGSNILLLNRSDGSQDNSWVFSISSSNGGAVRSLNVLAAQNTGDIVFRGVTTGNGQFFMRSTGIMDVPGSGNVAYRVPNRWSIGDGGSAGRMAVLGIGGEILMQMGGTTSQFPALRRNNTELQTKLADDSVFAPHRASIFTAQDTVQVQFGGATTTFYARSLGAQVSSNGVFSWSSNTNAGQTQDTSLTRVAAGVVGVGTGAAGSVAGTLRAAKIGVETSSPSNLIHTFATSGSNQGVRIENTGTGASDNAAIQLLNSAISSTIFTTTPSHPTAPSTTGFYTNAANGFVVIGATSPILRVRTAGTNANQTEFGGSIKYAYRSISANRTLDTTDNLIFVDTSAGDITVTLPSAAAYGGNNYKVFKINAANTLNVNTLGGNINGSSTGSFTSVGCTDFYSDGSNWWIG
jgi:hypothetical protein